MEAKQNVNTGELVQGQKFQVETDGWEKMFVEKQVVMLEIRDMI